MARKAHSVIRMNIVGISAKGRKNSTVPARAMIAKAQPTNQPMRRGASSPEPIRRRQRAMAPAVKNAVINCKVRAV